MCKSKSTYYFTSKRKAHVELWKWNEKPQILVLMQAVVSEAALQSLEGALSSHNPIKSAVIIQRTLGHA